MTDQYEAIIRSASKALEPLSTSIEPHLPRLSGVRAVLFDIYGTLLVSASGDVGASDPQVSGEAIGAAVGAVGGEHLGDAGEAAAEFRRVIERQHQQSRDAGVDFPEVDIVDVWHETCDILAERGRLKLPAEVDFARLAIEFETRVNPVWPMPGLADCLAELCQGGRVMGIISNAQFFTPLVFPALVGKSVAQLGFAPQLRYYSYEHRCAKPGRKLYEMAATGLASMNIEADETLYVGNDMRNDIWPAAAVGFRTALFAGDRRSLRLRDDMPDRANQPDPDATVTELSQILQLIDA